MADLAHNTDYVGEARVRLLEQFKNKPRIDALLVAFMAEAQELEDAMFMVFVDRLLQNDPTGDLLDRIGSIVGQVRGGASDDEYRVFITARIRANRSDGRHETLIDIVDLLIDNVAPQFDGSNGIVFRTYLKALEIELLDIQVDPYIVFNSFLANAVVAGDNIKLFFSTQPVANTLVRMSVHPDPAFTTLTTQRKGSVHGTYGGGLFGGVF